MQIQHPSFSIKTAKEKSGGFTVNPGFNWGAHSIADWHEAGEAIITNDGQTYSPPLRDGPVISSAAMDMLHD
ncbi:hypothetical protein [Pseudomonas sp. B28(2017)]|uniref:hypothetical protein n=1 Tax=Pseudomonas sp. B28(2017) TaxID=1981730 RepID=UPI00117AE85B|nr:hypothetical protein [Pseudomonas sp. B28(2017)]